MLPEPNRPQKDSLNSKGELADKELAKTSLTKGFEVFYIQHAPAPSDATSRSWLRFYPLLTGCAMLF